MYTQSYERMAQQSNSQKDSGLSWRSSKSSASSPEVSPNCNEGGAPPPLPAPVSALVLPDADQCCGDDLVDAAAAAEVTFRDFDEACSDL